VASDTDQKEGHQSAWRHELHRSIVMESPGIVMEVEVLSLSVGDNLSQVRLKRQIHKAVGIELYL
jgi:hypothetical protein